MGRDLKEQLLDATINIYGRKGMKFTMDDIAHEISKSKKTIYTVFPSKDDLLIEMVNYYFDKINTEEQKIMEDSSKGVEEKLRGVLSILPECHRGLDLRQMYVLCDKYPRVFQQIRKRMEGTWENMVYLLRRGMEEGCFRRFNIRIFKLMLETSVARFFGNDVLSECDLEYQEAVDEIVGLLVDGILA